MALPGSIRFKNMKFSRLLISLLFIGSAAISCCEKAAEKPKYIWMAIDNYPHLSCRDSIAFYLDKCKDVGFNWAVLDVRGCDGIMVTDNLQTFIDEAHKRDMKVSVAATIFPAGSPYHNRGLVYDDPSIKDLTCLEYKSDGGFTKIEDDHKEVAAFMNPLLPESQEIALSNIKAILDNYDVDGFSLDYCRFPNATADFSDRTRAAFEEFLGEKVSNWPADVFSYDGQGNRVPGKYYKKWWLFRAQVIHDFVARVNAYMDESHPDVELEYWAATWLHALYGTGQNWASGKARYYEDYLDDWADPDYYKTGFASELDVFMAGAYLERVWGMEDLESVEYALARTNRDVAGDCKVVGSFQIASKIDIEEAVYACMTLTEGLMVFDMSHTFSRPEVWEQIRRGIERAENE